MPKEGREDSFWKALCDKLAAGQKPPSKQGWMPGANSIWKGRIQKILACGVTKRKQSKSSVLPFVGGSAACTCGWDHEKYDRDNQPAPAAPAAAAAPPRPQKKIEFGILCKPPPRKKLSDIRGRHHVYPEENGCYALEVFGFTNGKCPHCKSSNIEAGNRNDSVKTIYTRSGKPRFVQGMGLKCNDCDGKAWQSYEKTYVDTLTKKQQDKLHAIIAGKRSGVDMDIIRAMRRGAPASMIASESLANLTRLHALWEEDYDENCRIATERGFDVVEQPFPDLEESGLPALAAKADVITVAFLRDYITTRPELLREMASYISEISMAIDHQKKVVKHAVGNNGASSFTIVGDGGIVLGYYIVPDDGEDWLKAAMIEMVKRHGAVLNDDLKTVASQGNLPKVIYVDKLCCGGSEGSRADAVRYFYGMLKKLDLFTMTTMNREG